MKNATCIVTCLLLLIAQGHAIADVAGLRAALLAADPPWPPLHVAVIVGDAAEVEQRILAGDDVNAYTHLGTTALHHAVSPRFIREVFLNEDELNSAEFYLITELLMDAGADVNAPTDGQAQGKTAYDYADDPALKQLLVARGGGESDAVRQSREQLLAELEHEETDDGASDSGMGTGLGIGRAIAGLATGAVMADAVMRGADPEDVAQLGRQVIDMIEGDSTTAATTQDSGFQGFELPDENRREVFGDAPPIARVAQSASGGQCEFPWMLDDSPLPTDITAIRLSWCNASDTSMLHLRANAAATQQCQLVYWKQDGRPAADIDGLSRTIRQACAYANELSNGAYRCPDWYGR